MPPDVRQGYALPYENQKLTGYAPGSGFAHFEAGGRTKGQAHLLYESSDGAAQPRLTSGGVAERTTRMNNSFTQRRSRKNNWYEQLFHPAA
jgi:hypothetical protein